MPNQFHYRAHIDRLWRQSGDHNPGYIRVKALGTLVRDLYAPTERARLNHQLYFATDPYDVACHKLRDLYDGPHTSPAGGGAPQGAEGGAPEAPPGFDQGRGPVPLDEDTPEEDDDPL